MVVANINHVFRGVQNSSADKSMQRSLRLLAGAYLLLAPYVHAAFSGTIFVKSTYS